MPGTQLDEVIRDAGFEDILKGETRTDREKYSAFKDKIEDNDLIILLDDYHEVEGKETFKAFLSFVDEYLARGHLIIIGRDNVAGITAINPRRMHIAGLGLADSVKHARSLIDHMYSSVVVSDEVLKKICATLQGYPLAIDLAVDLLSSNVSPDEITKVAVREAKEGNTRIEVIVRRLLNEVFTRTDTTLEEITFLKLFSVFRGKVETAAAQAIMPESIFRRTSLSLINRNILSIYDGFYELHPLIREYCYELLEQKADIHVRAANYYKTLQDEKLNPELEEKTYWHLAAAAQWQEISKRIADNGREFISRCYLDQLRQMIKDTRAQGISQDIYDVFEGDIAQLKGDWHEAIAYFGHAKSSTNAVIKLEATIKGGEMLFRQCKYREAKIIFEKAIEDTEGIELKNWHARAINDLGLIYWKNGYIEHAIILLERALQLRDNCASPVDVSATRSNIAIIKSKAKKYDSALALLYKNLQFDTDEKNRWGLGNDLAAIGTVMMETGKYDEALKHYFKALEIIEEIGDKNLKARILGNIGIVKQKTAKYLEALIYHKKGLAIAEEMNYMETRAACLCNVGVCLNMGDSNMPESCFYLIKSIAVNRLLANQNVSDQLSWLSDIKRKVGTAYKEIVVGAFDLLDDDLKRYINVSEILLEPRSISQKIGRNALCPCGSGKKYKNCHSAS